MSCAIIIWVWFIGLKLKRSLVLFIPIITAILLWIVMDLESVLQAIVNKSFVGVGRFPAGAKILALADIFKGRIDDQTSTGRTLMWSIVLGRSWSSFPVGTGVVVRII